MYDLDDLPKSLITIGGGVESLEYGEAFGRLGVEAIVVEMGARLLPGADRKLVNHLLRALQTDCIRLMRGTKAKSLRNHQAKVVLAYEKADGDAGEVQAAWVLVALGRRPDLDELALDRAGVIYTPRGIIKDKTLRTSAPNIYACGDIAGGVQSFGELLVRPLGRWRAYCTQAKDICMCSSSMPPGGWVHEMCRLLAAKEALKGVLC